MPNYPRHLETFDYIGLYRYFLTFCTPDRQLRFRNTATVDSAWSQILRASRQEDIEITACCFMPDHAHLVVEGTSEVSNLKTFVARGKQYSGYYHSEANNEKLWQRYGHERVLRDDEATHTVVRYVLENPVRAGLVSHPSEYPYIRSSRYSLAELLDFAYGPADAGPYEYQVG